MGRQGNLQPPGKLNWGKEEGRAHRWGQEGQKGGRHKHIPHKAFLPTRGGRENGPPRRAGGIGTGKVPTR